MKNLWFKAEVYSASAVGEAPSWHWLITDNEGREYASWTVLPGGTQQVFVSKAEAIAALANFIPLYLEKQAQSRPESGLAEKGGDGQAVQATPSPLPCK